MFTAFFALSHSNSIQVHPHACIYSCIYYNKSRWETDKSFLKVIKNRSFGILNNCCGGREDRYEDAYPVCFAHSSTQASGFSGLPRDPNRYVKKSKALAAARVNFQCGASPDGETKPSNMPAMIRIGMTPTTSRTASAPARVSESRRECRPGKSSPRAMMNPAPPAIKIAGNSNTPWAATKLHSERLMP